LQTTVRTEEAWPEGKRYRQVSEWKSNEEIYSDSLADTLCLCGPDVTW
jgi:hypothetical protein